MVSVRAILVLCRISNLPTVISNSVAAWFLAGGGWNPLLPAGAAAGCLVYIGGMILNDVFDVEWDLRHGKPRPIPRRQIRLSTAAWLGWTSLGLGTGCFLLLGTNPLWTVGLAAAVLAYDALHKRWTGSIWLMGACRFFLFLTVASLADPYLPVAVWIWGASLAIYVAGVTLAARGEDTGGGLDPFALACLLLPGLAAAGLFLSGQFAARLPLLGLILFAGWILAAYRGLRRDRFSIGGFVGRLLAGMVLLDVMAVSPVEPLAALLCLLLLPLNLLLQRFVPPT